jgi:hypothetical protein
VVDVASDWARYAESEKAARQRDMALRHANDVRTARAQLKRDMKEGRVRLADVLAEPPACTARMPLEDLLLAAPGIGDAKARDLLRDVGLSGSRRVGGLTVGERQRLADALLWR